MNDSPEHQTPMQEVGERMADTMMGGLMMFPQMVAVRNFSKEQKDYRRRVDDSHRQQAAALRGDNPPEPADSDEEDDSMGDTFIACGDVYGDEATKMLRQVAAGSDTDGQPQTLPEQVKSSLIAKAAPYLLVAALGGGGVAAGVLPWLSNKTSEPPSVTDTDTTRRVDVEVWRPDP